jgi:sulfur oxidation c-type cytochrome SoxA
MTNIQSFKFQKLIPISLSLLLGVIFLLLSNCGSTNKIQRYSDPSQAELVRNEELKTLSRGKVIWFDPNTGTNGRSCESCHPGGEMTNSESYPRYKHVLRTMATLSMTHNFAVVNESKGRPWELGSEEANALVLFVMSLANGKPIRMAWPKEYRNEWINRGKAAFIDSSLGTNRLSCQSCHQEGGKRKNFSAGKMTPELKGIAATYPQYSFVYQKVITLEQQVNYCIEQHLKGAPLPLDDQTIVALCCYLTSLSEGTKINVARFKE